MPENRSLGHLEQDCQFTDADPFGVRSYTLQDRECQLH
jgi:hypothetical protein